MLAGTRVVQLPPAATRSALAHFCVVMLMPASWILTQRSAVLSALVHSPAHLARYVSTGPYGCGHVAGHWNCTVPPVETLALMAPGAAFLWQMMSGEA